MKAKELKIQAPEGYEIDKENSTFECIKFKPIQKYITYEDVCNTIFVNEDTYFISDGSCIHKGILPYWDNDIIPNKNIATNEKQLKRLLALNQLLNIAEYFNSIHPKQNCIQYYIIKNDKNWYDVVEYKWLQYILGTVALFNRKEDAQAVIGNPNFQEILDIVYEQ